MALLTSVVFVLVLLLAAVGDLKDRRIPNVLTFGALAAGLGLRAATGPTALMDGLEGGGLAALVAVPFFMLGALGGGDTKLLVALGSFFGPGRMVGALLLIAFLGGLLAVVDAVRRGILGPVLLSCVDVIKSWGTFGRAGAVPQLGQAGALTVPYGVAIATGALVWWFWGVDVL